MTALLEAAGEAEALEELHAMGCTDGLPVVIPTAERVERAVLATGLPGDAVVGVMGPVMGSATVEKVAIAAVMAGCLPDHMPLVLAAVQAVCEPEFDLTEMQATTHSTAPLMIVNGPVRHACGIAGGFGALGPGFRGNASAGRALRLAMINIGGGRAGESDMALLGHPGKFTYCLGEDEENSPFDPLHVSLGFGAEESAVTVIGADSPHSVIFVSDKDDPDSPDRLLDNLAQALVNPATNNGALRGGAAVVVLNPDHAQVMADAGYGRSEIAAEIARRGTVTRSQLMSPGQAGANDAERLPGFFDAADVLVIVAGGGGLYSVVMPSWCAGPHRNRFVSKPVAIDQACEIPGFTLDP